MTTTFENTVEIGRSRGEVFSYLAELGNLPAWNYAIKRTVRHSPGPVGVGTLYIQERSLPRPMTEELTVTAFEPDSLLRVSGGFGPYTGSSTYELTSAGDGGTLLRNTIELEPQGILSALAAIATRKVKSAVAENLLVLKKILES
ncbi:Polyketide cyclase / dehydrase and lipid transport [Streptomyces sp. DvalAA-14]|uniref:SRPBCC family protein n=1 Tax=unclassified Streptomyces TaxID=2593676 RepID=UPI00081B06DD|nr:MULTISPECIES: SRPBCC family protein [unclassified Streptomyces]MYS22159.1 hypothetical protein [Streptomyces sp. SID4948]SCE09893.1 Polyketide cyclase / dehydrase and lipid transport [Streptomyces sp. DvalAA-14]